jgi:hypothetical protein
MKSIPSQKSTEQAQKWENMDGASSGERPADPGGSDLQFLNVDGQPLYQHVARHVATKWNRH